MNMSQDAMETTLAERGWLALELPDPSAIFETRDFLLAKLLEILPSLDRLENYHHHVTDDERHVAIMFDLANAYWQSGLSRSIITRNLALFRQLIGTDLLIQPAPYLRCVRPVLPSDAAPLHRDTYYGASPYEVSVVIPFTEMEASQALRVISGSHIAPDSDYPYTQTVSPDVEIRSPKHQLGYPYAPRLLDPALMEKTQPVPLKVGEVLMFPLQLVHGEGINTGERSRFSTDIRLANSLAPVEWSRGVRKDYFVPLCTSAVTRSAQVFLAANADRPVGPAA
jgi:Phytanoyl-CoA dioxygenase (PhyH)